MSRGSHNSSHRFGGPLNSRARRLRSKLGRTIPLTRLERLLGETAKRSMREVRPMKALSISISGSGQISDELAEKVHAVADELRGIEGVAVSVATSDAASIERQDAGGGVQAGG